MKLRIPRLHRNCLRPAVRLGTYTSEPDVATFDPDRPRVIALGIRWSTVPGEAVELCHPDAPGSLYRFTQNIEILSGSDRHSRAVLIGRAAIMAAAAAGVSYENALPAGAILAAELGRWIEEFIRGRRDLSEYEHVA